jgi:hypothetical protein
MQMKTVYLVDETTRIILPDSAWAKAVLAEWASCGISAVATGEDPETCKRDTAEMARMSDYLDMIPF